jgi:endonuclease/exonuclease/phosphatase family metal-dependent hydrolase
MTAAGNLDDSARDVGDNAGSVNLATWNVRHATPTSQIVATVEDLIARHELAVVCLQELAPFSVAPPRVSVHRALARATGWKAVLAVHPRLYPGWVEAVGILTRLPIVRSRMIRLGRSRGYVQAVLRSAVLGEVCVGCVHLSSPGRRRQELRRAVLEAPERRYVVAGDFNLAADDAILSTEVPHLTSDGLPGMDHIYVTGDLRLVECHIERTAASDHDAIVAVIDART